MLFIGWLWILVLVIISWGKIPLVFSILGIIMLLLYPVFEDDDDCGRR